MTFAACSAVSLICRFLIPFCRSIWPDGMSCSNTNLLSRSGLRPVPIRGGGGDWMMDMGKSGNGAVWIGITFALPCLTAVSTFVAFWFGFDFDPDDKSGSHYRAEIAKRQWVMAASVAIPAMADMASVRSILNLPREVFWITASSVFLLIALAAAVFCWIIGIESIESAKDFAERFGG
ncbi:hypothetical protein ACSVHC_05400 [Arthrobacter sp. KNU-44]|uniref:hypothetical protein n=1 Tax=unclassified Arthrobacter TaxID=235627 RepID=UPI003F41DD50